MIRWIVPILGSIIGAAACSAETVPAGAIRVDGHVLSSCIMRGGESAACACVSREAQLRFNTAELELIVGANRRAEREEFASRVESASMSPADQDFLIRRVTNADIVIRQSCGLALLNQLADEP